MMKTNPLIHIFLLLVSIPTVFAEIEEMTTGETPVLSKRIELSALIQHAFEANPSIQSARSEWAKTVERFPQETSLDDPMLSFSYYAEQVETRVGPQNYALSLKQTFPFPGTLKQKGRVVAKEIEIAELRYEQTIRDTIAQLKHDVYELLYLDTAITTAETNQELMGQILGYAQTHYANQQTTFSEVMSAESQLAQLDYDLINYRELRHVQIAVINGLLNQALDAEIGMIVATYPKSASMTLHTLDSILHQRNQEIQMARFSAEKSDESLRLAKKRNLPMFSLGATYIETGHARMANTQDSGKDPIIIGGSMSIPLWHGRNKARVRYALENRLSSIQQQTSVINTMRVALRKAWYRWENAKRLEILYREELLPQASHTLELAQEWQRNQQGTLSNMLETQSVWFNYQLAYHRALADMAQRWIELERLAGGSLNPPQNQEVNR